MTQPECLDGPAVGGETRGPSGGCHATGLGQTRLRCAEVRDRPAQKQAVVPEPRTSGQSLPSPRQPAVSWRALHDVGEADMAPRVPPGTPGGLVACGSRHVSRLPRISATTPSVPPNSGHWAAPPGTRALRQRLRVMSRCSLTSPARHARGRTILARVLHTLRPWALTRHSAAGPAPPALGCQPVPANARPCARVIANRDGARVQRTPGGQQGPHETARLRRRPQTIQREALRGRERRTTLGADAVRGLAGGDADVALACGSSGGPGQCGAAGAGRVPDHAPLLVVLGSMPRRSRSGPLFP
jgi:hypothetical protein